MLDHLEQDEEIQTDDIATKATSQFTGKDLVELAQAP